MEPRKLSVGFAFFPYGGNGAAPAEHPAIRNWFVRTALYCKSDPRISDVYWEDFNDTPITMTRNASVKWARENKIDVLVMVDSDNIPDLYLGSDPTAVPFFKSSFEFVYANYDKGPHVIGAPYCGHPMNADGTGSENIFVFLWRSEGNFDRNNANVIEAGVSLAQMSREEASLRAGIEEVAALPTGCIMFDVRAFDLLGRDNIFDYEYVGDGGRCKHCGVPKHGFRAEKASTEDVVLTRDLSLHGCIKLGYNPVFCNWDAWAGHVKPQIVGKPRVVAANAIAKELGEAFAHGIQAGERRAWIGPHARPGEKKPQEAVPAKENPAAHESNGHAPQVASVIPKTLTDLAALIAPRSSILSPKESSRATAKRRNGARRNGKKGM